ncbi:MAG: discoidin domain-containing protein [Bacteroidota bacterium]
MKKLVLIIAVAFVSFYTVQAQQMKPLDLVLPSPMFVGTPQNFDVPNLEKPKGGARPPFMAPAGTKNISEGKAVSASDELPIIGEIDQITDGDKDAGYGSFVELGPDKQWAQVDLGASYTIYAVILWHYHQQARVYLDVVVQISDDPEFKTGVKTIFNNDNDNTSGFGVGKDMNYVETNEGKLIDAKGTKGRYVRCYSNGNTYNDLNHYVEIEVHGK